MSTDLHDTALPRFEDRLWAELSDAHRERQDQRRPAVVTPHRPNRRRRPLAAGAAVAVAAAPTLARPGPTRPRARSACGRSTTTAPCAWTTGPPSRPGPATWPPT
jgi:ferric-dicitrate binding protein FerR (iron transport regulator)